MNASARIPPEAVSEFLEHAKVEVLDGDGDEFVIEFDDGRTFLLVATEMES